MSERTTCTVPMLECLHCGCEWQEDDYYDGCVDDIITCPHCERGMRIEAVETILEWTLVKEADDE